MLFITTYQLFFLDAPLLVFILPSHNIPQPQHFLCIFHSQPLQLNLKTFKELKQGRTGTDMETRKDNLSVIHVYYKVYTTLIDTHCLITVSIQDEFASGTLQQARAEALMMKSLKERRTPSPSSSWLNSCRSCATASMHTSTLR